jgi:plastocyanin
MRRLIAILCLGLAACGGSASPDGGDATADVDLENAPGVYGMAPAISGFVPAIVTLRPLDEATPITSSALASMPPNPKIDQFGLAFSPTLLVVAAGAQIAFTNSEGALAHNVHVRRLADGESLLNEDANSGDELSLVLSEPGGYDILCDMHPGMNAFVFASDTPYAVFAESDGAFALGEIPSGDYEVRVWTVEEGFDEPVAVSVTDGRLDLDLQSSH